MLPPELALRAFLWLRDVPLCGWTRVTCSSADGPVGVCEHACAGFCVDLNFSQGCSWEWDFWAMWSPVWSFEELVVPGHMPHSPRDGWRGCSPVDPGAEWETHTWHPDFVASSGLSLEPNQGPLRLAACGPFPPCRLLAGSCVRLHRSLCFAGGAGLGPRTPWESQGVPSSHLGAWEAPAGPAWPHSLCPGPS